MPNQCQITKVKRYSEDRHLAACLVDEILSKVSSIRSRFNEYINKNYQSMLKVSNYEPVHDLFLLWCMPDEICKAAIFAIDKGL